MEVCERDLRKQHTQNFTEWAVRCLLLNPAGRDLVAELLRGYPFATPRFISGVAEELGLSRSDLREPGAMEDDAELCKGEEG